MQAKNIPTTVKGAWKQAKRLSGEMSLPLKVFAFNYLETNPADDPMARKIRYWFDVKRPGGTDEQRAARREKRKEQRAIRALSRKGKSSLKSSKSKGGSKSRMRNEMDEE